MKRLLLSCAAAGVLFSCSQVDIPGVRNLKIPQPTQATERKNAVNERPDAVMYLPLGKDVLIPEVPPSDPMPSKVVGPFELRGETLAGALQLITSDFNLPMAFESEEALTRTVTVSNMKGPMGTVVNRVCSLADLYCSYEDGTLVVKDTQTFTVSIPPVGGASDIIDAISSGIQGITGLDTIVDSGTRTVIYEATQRSAGMVNRYFQRMRRSTAMIVFEIYIWEVSLNNDNATGISWSSIQEFGKFSSNISVPSSVPGDLSPISIGLPSTGNIATDDVVRFISEFGAVKTISQPQITMLSGSSSTLRAADTINYVSSLNRTVDNGEVSISTQTDSVDTGFTLNISADWDNASVYSDIAIELQEFRRFETFGEGTEAELQLPETTEREVETQVRIRPGDSLLIAGLVRESDQFDIAGPGFNKPIIPTSRNSLVSNVELVFLMKPRVIVYTTDKESGPVQKKASNAMQPRDIVQKVPVTESEEEKEKKIVPPVMIKKPLDEVIEDVQSQEENEIGTNDFENDNDGMDMMTPDMISKPLEEEETGPMIGTVPIDLLNPNAN